MPAPYAYIRKSTQGGAESMGDQIANVRAIVERNGRPQDGASLVLLTADWGISASREKRAKRLDMTRLIEAIRAGEVSHVYAYSHDRLARDVETSAALLNAMADAGIECTTGERTWHPRDGMDRQQWHFTAMQGEAYVEQAQRKAADRVVRQRERGVALGQRPYGSQDGEDASAVVAAFKEAGSYMGAVRLLIERGIPSRRGHLPNRHEGIGGGMQGWSASTVSRIIAREAPELVPPAPTRGARTRATHLFTRLLVCPHDGAVMTTMPRPDASTAYMCREGHRAPKGTHPRPYVIAETWVTDWAKRETAGILRMKRTAPPDTDIDVDGLKLRLERLALRNVEGAISDAAYETARRSIEADITKAQAVTRAQVTLKLGLNWAQPTADINMRLRELWAGIRLAYVPSSGPRNHVHTRDLDLVPVGAVWRVKPDGFEDFEGAEETADGWYVPSGQGWDPREEE